MSTLPPVDAVPLLGKLIPAAAPVGSVRRECLDHVLVLGERHLLETLVEYSGYFNSGRNHQGVGQLIPAGTSKAAAGRGPVIANAVLSGLHHDYRRAA